jgi:hypothetical protein
VKSSGEDHAHLYSSTCSSSTIASLSSTIGSTTKLCKVFALNGWPGFAVAITITVVSIVAERTIIESLQGFGDLEEIPRLDPHT